ncbi:MAG: site-specific DNA-methyltransferase [Cetobacterium sp.]
MENINLLDLEELKKIASQGYGFYWRGKGQAFKDAENDETEFIPYTENNMYIEGDNIVALKRLQREYEGKVKMIYIDPPYNTGRKFVYNDRFRKKNDKLSYGDGRHSNWLNMMYPRLKTARDLLTDDGAIFIQIDDNEVGNLKKICDEILGETNFINILSIKMKNTAGASGNGEDKKFKKNIEYILVYAKNYFELKQFKNSYEYTEVGELVNRYRENNVSWKYTSILYEKGNKKYIASTEDSDGNEIKIYSRKNVIIKSINQIMKDENISEREAYVKYSKQIFQTVMPQSSIRPRVMKKVGEIGKEDEIYSIEYIPKSGKNKGILYEQFYKGDNFRLFAWLKDVSEEINGVLYKKDLIGTFLDYVGETKNLSKEGEIGFQNGKKPIKLLKKLIEMQTNSGDIILDFFSGSASTAHAVMQLNAEDGGGRKFIMVQLPETCSGEFPNICELGKERIRRAGEKIKADESLSLENRERLNVVFDVVRL